MNTEEFREHQKKFMGSLLERARDKQREYADDDNPFYNFEDAVGITLDKERESAAWGMCAKQIQSIKNIVRTLEARGKSDETLTQELLDEKVGDVIVYMTLLHGMLTERINTYKQFKPSTI